MPHLSAASFGFHDTRGTLEAISSVEGLPDWMCQCGVSNLGERSVCRECEAPAPPKAAHTIAVVDEDEADGAESFMSVDVDIPDAQLGARMREMLVKRRSSSGSRFHIIGKAAKTRRASV